MPLNQKIAEDLKDAIKAKDSVRTSCLRMLKTSLKNIQVDKGRDLEDEEINAAISSSVRKCKEAAKEFRKGGREDLALKEEQEIKGGKDHFLRFVFVVFHCSVPQLIGITPIRALRDISESERQFCQVIFC